MAAGHDMDVHGVCFTATPGALDGQHSDSLPRVLSRGGTRRKPSHEHRVRRSGRPFHESDHSVHEGERYAQQAGRPRRIGVHVRRGFARITDPTECNGHSSRYMFAMFNVESSPGHGDCLCGTVCVRDRLRTSSSGLRRSWVAVSAWPNRARPCWHPYAPLLSERLYMTWSRLRVSRSSQESERGLVFHVKPRDDR